ncbi:hypothetical protein GCM10022226_36070 [Sphaerisporangium flaviroseum]|uniref:Uncharacterized protein n=1 Tax=Sphaerisporangium flaviroseum TaxID=509199 RepID=A0ABP7I8J4_9ACTN
MSSQRARTLVEAYLYIRITARAAEGEGHERHTARDYEAQTALTEGPDEWRLFFDGRDLGLALRIDVHIPYRAEADARRDGLRFGHGTSELIDAGQWRMVSSGYAERAMREDLRFIDTPTDADLFGSVVLGWESARDAVAEAAKFLPPTAKEVPPSAFWTETGRAAHRERPDLFTRESLERDIASYEEARVEFIVMHTSARP